MNSRKITALLVVAFALLVIAGTKVSQLTRTRSLQSTSRFMVSTQDASSGRWSSRYITAPDLATNLGTWITNSGSGSGGSATNAIGNNNGNGTNTALYGNLTVVGPSFFQDVVTSSNNFAIYGDLTLGAYPNVSDELDSLQARQPGSATLTNLSSTGVNRYATNAAWGNFFSYDTNAADYIVSASVTNEPARERLDNFVRQIKRAGLWSTMLDAASMFRYHQDSATTFKTLKGYATSQVNATQTLDDNGVLLDGTPTAAPMWHVPNITNYTLVVAYRTFTNMATAQSHLVGIFNTNSYLNSYAAIETQGDDYFYFASSTSNGSTYAGFQLAVTTNAPAAHHKDSMRHSVGYWHNSLGGYKAWVDGLYSRSNTTAVRVTNSGMTELVLGGYVSAPGTYPDGTFRGYIESWALFDGQLTDEQVKNVDMALRSLAPQRVNLIVEGTSLEAWNGIGFAGDVFWNWPFQLWQNPSISNSFVVYNHAMAGARLITPTGGFGSMANEYTNTIQYLRPETYGGAYGVEKAILALGPPANDFVDGITAAAIYAAYVGLINTATADGFEVWASTCGAAQMMDATQNARRQVFNAMLLTNSAIAKRLIRRDLLFPDYTTNSHLYYDGTHLSVTGNVEIARQILNMEGSRNGGVISTNGIPVGPIDELNVVNGGNLTIAAVNDPDLRKVTLTLTGSAASGGTNNPVTLSAGTLTLISSQTARYYTNSAGSFPFTFSGTPNASSRVSLAVSNTSASAIYITNTSGIYDPRDAAVVTTMAIPAQAQSTFHFRRNATSGWELEGVIEKPLGFEAGINTTLRTNAGNVSVVGAFSFSTNGSSWISATQLVARSGIVISNDTTGTVSFHVQASGSGGPTTNAPPQTLAINGGTGSTNVVLDMRALGATNYVRFTLTANAGIVVTNVVDGKEITVEVVQDSTGNRTLAQSSVGGAPLRFGADITGFALSTNGTYLDKLRLHGTGTNAQIVGNLRGYAP